MQYGNRKMTAEDKKREIEFKSHYVVWKPNYSCHFTYFRLRLNRTMQYGNDYILWF